MHKLDPIERLPDGSLFRLTPGQLRSVRGLTKRCCNFSGGDCLLLDGACPQYISRSLLCRWFRRAVLPQQPKREQSILSPKKLHRCEVCGMGILARSGRAKYCPACAKEVHRQQKAKSARKRRFGVDNLGAAREIVLPRGFCGAGRLAIQGLFAPKLSTPNRRLRADFAFC